METAASLSYSPTPLQALHHPVLDKAGVNVVVKREDLNHPSVSGNKWWKLKYNLLEAARLGKKKLLTFGGAYSNHIYATAAAARELGWPSIGLIRGEETLPLNSTLAFARAQGMHLHYISRDVYRHKHEPAFVADLQKRFGDVYIVPEGGTNRVALQGAKEFAETLQHLPFDHLFLPVGTGGTMAGIIAGLADRSVVGVNVLKGDFLKREIEMLLADFYESDIKKKSVPVYGNWSLLTSYHHGGYAKVTPALMEFIREMNKQHGLPLDPVYTGKMLWALLEEVRRGGFPRGSSILALHTGGLQGNM